MIDLQGTMIVLHGPPKVGKTQLASHFPGPVQFIATEPGHRYLLPDQRKRLLRLPPDDDGESWKKFKKFVSNKNGLISRKILTAVVDTGGGLFDLCFRYVCQKHGVEHPGDMSHGKGWDAVKREFYDGLNRLAWATNKLDATLILITHSKEIEIETRTATKLKIQCDLTGTARKVVMPIPDHIWFLGYDVEKDPEAALVDFQSKRALFLDGSDTIEAGCRDPNIVRKIISPLSKTKPYEQIIKAINSQKKSE